MYALLNSQGQIQTYPYSVSQLRADNPGTSFPVEIPAERLAGWGVVTVEETPQPDYNPLTQNLIEAQPEQAGGVWAQVWQVTDATADQVAERTAQYNETQKQNRSEAYRDEADPLFFKWQREEAGATKEEWLAKIEEIKNRFQYI